MGKMKNRARIKELIQQAINHSKKCRSALKTAAMRYPDDYQEYFYALSVLEQEYEKLEQLLVTFDKNVV